MDNNSMIFLQDVEHPYTTKNNESLSLKRINLNISKGEIFGIMGHSGAGKSTLLRCINLLDKPRTGIVSIDNKNLTVLVNKELQHFLKNISMISSKPILLQSKNVYENIALPLELQDASNADIERIVNPILTITGLDNKREVKPKYLTPAQKQRVAIARALVNQPKVLLCDEITAGLDQRSSMAILKLLSDINKEFSVTMIMITHDIYALKNICDRIAVMKKGEIVEECSPLELFVRPLSDTAKEFIKAITKQELPWTFRKRISNEPLHEANKIVRISFVGCISPESILSQIINELDLNISIIQAYQEQIESETASIMIAEVEGSKDSLNHAIEFLAGNNLFVEILGYVTRTS